MIEADLQRYYKIDLNDFYRGEISPRRLGVLIRYLPTDSTLVSALNDGQPMWGSVEHLLADLWALLVRANTPKDEAPAEPLDHPVRAEMTERALAAAKAELKEFYLTRKRNRRTTKHAEGVTNT